MNNLKRFVVVAAQVVLVKHRKPGDDPAVTRMKLMIRMKIPHQLLDPLPGHLEEAQRDEAVGQDPLKTGPNRMINGVTTMIDLVDRR